MTVTQSGPFKIIHRPHNTWNAFECPYGATLQHILIEKIPDQRDALKIFKILAEQTTNPLEIFRQLLPDPRWEQLLDQAIIRDLITKEYTEP